MAEPIDGDDMDAVLEWLEMDPDELGALGDCLRGIISATAQIGNLCGLDQRATAFAMISAVGSIVAAQRNPADFEQMLAFLRQAIEKAPGLRTEAIERNGPKGRRRREQVH